MYHKDQEEIVFGIVLGLAILFHVVTLILVFQSLLEITSAIIFLIINVIIFFGIVKYAKWVWKTETFLGALKKVLKIESVPFGLFIVAYLVKILKNA